MLASLALLAAAPALAKRAATPVPRNAAEADALAASGGDVAAFRAWARGAPLDALMYVLRRTRTELGACEAPAAEAALARVPAARGELHAQLAARAAAATWKPRRGATRPVAPAMPSAFRAALLLPSNGDHAADAAELEAGFRAGLASRAVPGRPAIEVVRVSTGDDAPARAAAAFDSVAALAALACGGFQRDAALVLAAQSRTRGTPLLLAASDDPVPPVVATHAWTAGPAAAARGRALAQAAGAGTRDRVATLVSSAGDTAFASAFVAECRARGAAVALRLAYAPGNFGFTAESRALQRERVTLLLWDGDPNEAAPLLRQLTRDRVSLRLCGGAGLDPSRHHRETRVFLEGVRWVGADWALADSSRAALDRALGDAGPAGPLAVRGWLAGRAAGAALAGDAYTPHEVAAALERMTPRAADAGAPRTLDAPALGALLPVWIVRDGRSTAP